MLRTLSAAVLLTATGCVGTTDEGPAGAVLALEWEANPDAVRLIGLFAFDANQEGMRCQSYLAGEYDPFVEGSPAGLSFFAVEELAEGVQLLDGVTTGSRLILVEGYDAGGARIFLGCDGPVGIEANRKAEIDVTVVPDPSLGEE